MAIYSFSQLTSVALIALPSLDIETNAALAVNILEYAITLAASAASTASVYGLGRPANDGSAVQLGPVAVMPDNPNDGTFGLTTTATAWTVAPTAPATYLRRIYLPAISAAGVTWTFPRGLRIASSHSLVNWNIAAGSPQTQINAILDE